MKPEIIDIVNKEIKKKSIKLIHCLQRETNNNDEYHFVECDYSDHLREVNKITRLTTFKSNECVFDVIETEISGMRNIFLGHWNDGVIE